MISNEETVLPIVNVQERHIAFHAGNIQMEQRLGMQGVRQHMIDRIVVATFRRSKQWSYWGDQSRYHQALGSVTRWTERVPRKRTTTTTSVVSSVAYQKMVHRPTVCRGAEPVFQTKIRNKIVNEDRRASEEITPPVT